MTFFLLRKNEGVSEAEVKFGIFSFSTDRSLAPVDLGRMVEDFGFHSLFLPDHTHIPACRTTPFPKGGDLPEMYYRTYDPLVALSAVASVTSDIELGTAVCLLSERDAILTAKQVASLDQLSQGRVVLGVGAGWNREEIENHGVAAHRRFDAVRDRSKAMQAIWGSERSSFVSEFARFEDIYSWPKPIQTPHPPILLGGTGPSVLDRVLELGSGWLPIDRGDRVALRDRVVELRERSDYDVDISIHGVETSHAAVEHYLELGVTRCIFRVSSRSSQHVEHELRELSALTGVG